MGKSARRMSVGTPEQMTMSGTGTSATPGETSSFHTALEECLPSGHDVALGDRSCGGSSMLQKSEYFSPRVEEMMRCKSQFSSDVEHEIEHSKVYWSEVSGLSEPSEDNDQEELSEDNDQEDELSEDNDQEDELSEDDDQEELSEDNDQEEEVNRENREVFAELMNDPQWEHHERGHFSVEWTGAWKLGQKIAEGGQVAIFEVLRRDGSIDTNVLLKVFKRGSCLLDLKRQWPCGINGTEVKACIVHKGVMLEDGRFAFVISRCWGDLRKLIDQAKQEKNNQGPPFPYEWNGETLLAKGIMKDIANYMVTLHKQGIIHRDLKAANILVDMKDELLHVLVADYECSIGVVGTGFWRAPEILLALKNRSVIDFTEKVDVYSYAMTCFEVVTGCLPFEGELEACRASNDLVIGGQRPQLPSDLDVPLKDLIERCWNPIPNERPSFQEILGVLHALN